MQKELIITEKPSVARDIAKVLKCNTKRDGYIEGDKYIVTWAIGHLMTLFEPENYSEKYKKWDFNTLPILPEIIEIKPYPKTKKQLNIITNLVKRKDVETLIGATDSGREGELIFRYIYEYTKSKKTYKRLWISSMTDEAIRKGFNKLKDGKDYDRLYHSARCRAESDWLVGINATRAYTTKNHVLLSVGRVQTPTLALIVNRHKEVKDFVPEDYWEVEVDYGKFKGLWFKEKISGTKISKKQLADTIAEKISNQIGIVIKINNKKNKQLPPLLYDLTELQRDGNRQYGMTAKEVLNIAQDLYEKRKLITYPRTDSRHLSQDMKKVVKSTMMKINVEPFSKAIKPLLEKELVFNKRIIDDKKVTDHHAIIPSKMTPKVGSLSEKEYKIYRLIVKRFIAVFYEPHLYNTTEIIVDIIGETFVSKGKVVTKKGWKSLYSKDMDKKDIFLPELKKGDEVSVVNQKVLTKKTSPPKLYTEATLLSAMEHAGRFIEEEALREQLKNSGFGTPATRASIIERLIQVKYIKRKGKALYPTPKGIKLIAIVPDELKSPITTGKWEKGLSKIAQGELEASKFMTSINKFVIYLVKSANQTSGQVIFEQDEKRGNRIYKGATLGKCPICQDGEIVENSKAYYCTNWKQGCKMTIWKNTLEKYSKELDSNTIKELLNKKRMEEYVITQPEAKDKKVGTLELDKNGKVIFTISKAENGKVLEKYEDTN